MNTVREDGSRANPNIVFNRDALRSNALFDERLHSVVKDMIDGQDLDHRRGVDTIADRDATLAPNDVVFADEAVGSDADAGMGQVPEVVDMKDGAMHDERSISDFDPVRTSVQVSVLVQVSAASEPNVSCIADPDFILDCGPAVCFQDQTVGEGTEANAEGGWNPGKNAQEGLFPKVAGQCARLALDIGSNPLGRAGLFGLG